MSLVRKWLVAGMAAALVACGGGGGDAGSSAFGGNGTGGTDGGTSGGTTTSTATIVEVLSSSNTVSTAGEQVSITAVVKDSGNVGVANASVKFAASTGSLSSVTTTTDTNGLATAKFSAGGFDKSNRSATVTVTSGTAAGSIVLPVNGSKITVAGPTTLRLSDASLLTFKAVDSNGNPIANAALTLSSALGNQLSSISGLTDAQGQISVTYTATKAGAEVLAYSGLGVVGGLNIAISGEDFVFTSPVASQRFPVDTSQTLQIRYLKNGVGVSNKTIDFSTTNGVLTPSTGTTDAAGIVSVSISAKAAAAATVLAKVRGEAVQATLPISFVATVPARLVLQVGPTAISPNAGTAKTSQAQVVAKLLDANGNPVPGVTINFKRTADPSGGDLLQPAADTDSNGQAIVQYVAGTESTAANGVRLHAEVASDTTVFGDAALTVNQKSLFIALGTGNVISNADEQTYKKDWVSYVTDATGVVVPSVNLTAKVLPQKYRKGRLVWTGKVYAAAPWDSALDPFLLDSNGNKVLPPGYYISCANEDVFYGEDDPRSYNGFLDAGEDGPANLTANGNGVLDPGNVISLAKGNLTSDATGRATFSLLYAESYAPWIDVKLKVQALVTGTESITSSPEFVVDGSSADFTVENNPPAGMRSPFGIGTKCTDKF
ncbi:MAG: hypothetical protein RJA44_1691 [Pseudomonadota bacterium]